MIITEIYKGQGLGNQLWCYVTTRVIALDKGYKFGIMHPEKFKCLDFLDLDFGEEVIGGEGPEGGPPKTLPFSIKYYYSEKEIRHPKTNADIREYDKDLINILDNTKIDGYMQDEQYILHRKNEVRNWLKVKDDLNCTEYSNDNICIINFRGGEYVGIKEVFLPKEYWYFAISEMRKINPNFKFIVITDDIVTAKKFFPDFEVNHFNIGKDYSIINNAHYLILSNSSFAFFPAWLNERVKKVIAPKYWSSYNISDGYWSMGYNITSNWFYIDRSGKLQNYEECMQDRLNYKKGYLDKLPHLYEKRRYWLLKINITRKFKKLLKLILNHND